MTKISRVKHAHRQQKTVKGKRKNAKHLEKLLHPTESISAAMLFGRNTDEDYAVVPDEENDDAQEEEKKEEVVDLMSHSSDEEEKQSEGNHHTRYNSTHAQQRSNSIQNLLCDDENADMDADYVVVNPITDTTSRLSIANILNSLEDDESDENAANNGTDSTSSKEGWFATSDIDIKLIQERMTAFLLSDPMM